jgi:hypothetical protein
MRFTEEKLPPPLYRAHPAFGLLRVEPDEPLFALTERQYPAEWLELPEEQREEMLTSWYSDLLEVATERGQSRLLVELSDSHGIEGLRGLNQCVADAKNPFAFECQATRDVIRAALETNPSRVFLLVDGKVCVSVFDAWEGMFLHVDDADLVERFGPPAKT